MGIKIYNSILKSIRLGDLGPSNLVDFSIISNRDLSTLYPAFTDSTSSGVSKFSFNMGQNPFAGDNGEYQPFHPEYNPANLIGNYTTEGSVIVPSNLNTVIYNLKYTTGKYYFEVNIEDAGRYGAVGLAPSEGNDFRIVEGGVGVSGIGFAREFMTYSSDVRISQKGSYNSADDVEYAYSNYDVLSGDVLQVFLDYDLNHITIRKVGTTIEDHVNYQNI